jgi:hypothetical protein
MKGVGPKKILVFPNKKKFPVDEEKQTSQYISNSVS